MIKLIFDSSYLSSEDVEMAFVSLITIVSPDGLYFSDYVFESFIFSNLNFNLSMCAGKLDDGQQRITNGDKA